MLKRMLINTLRKECGLPKLEKKKKDRARRAEPERRPATLPADGEAAKKKTLSGMSREAVRTKVKEGMIAQMKKAAQS